MTDMHDKMIAELNGLTSKPANLDRDPLLQARETTHGSFDNIAAISQYLKRLFREHNKGRISPPQAEALDCIGMKIGRILSGNPNTKDHWDDIAGYAKLGSEACE